MPPIYFHGNYSSYKEYNNIIRESKFSATKQCFSAQPPPLAVHFHYWWARVCMLCSLQSALAEMTHCSCHHCWNASPTASLCSHPLFGLHEIQQALVNVSGLHFSTGRNSVTHLCFIYTSTLDVIVSVPLLPSVTWQQHVTGYWWEGSTSTVIPLASVSWQHGAT